MMPTLEMKVSFYAPVPAGTLKGVGRVAKMGKTIAFLEGELLSADGDVLAKSSATGRLMPIPKA